MDNDGAIVDEVHYTGDWNVSNGISMEVHDALSDNSLVENWFASTLAYGFGDYGTPGNSYEGNLSIENQNVNPDQFIVYNLFPNPFNGLTTIKLYSEKSQRITIQTFDLVGRELHDLEIKYIKAGNTQLQWNGSNYVSGIYFLKISSPSTHIFKKVVLVK